MTDELDVLEPVGSSVTYMGRELKLMPIKVGQVPALVRTARPVLDAVLSLESLPDDDDGAMVGLVMDMIAEHGDAVFEAAALLTGEPADELRKGEIDEFVVLAEALFKVNRDFFDRRLAPLLASRAAARQAPSGVGPTPSSS